MRKKIFGAFAAMAVGAGAVSAQTPFPPYGGHAGSPYTNQPIPAMIPGGPNGAVLPQLNPGPGMIPPGADPAQMLPPNHQPVYPPPGPYAQTMYESPYTGGGGMGGPGMDGGGIPGPVAPRVWFKGDYLLMFLKPMPSNAVLVSTGLANNPGGTTDNGVLGQPSTVALFGDKNYEFNAVSGFRLEGGFWGSADQRLGASVGAVYIAPSSVNFSATSGTIGAPLFGRPIFNNNPNTITVNGTAGGNDIALVTNPGVGSGSILAQVQSRLFAIDANAILNLYRTEPGTPGWNLNLLVGYRYTELQESILVQSNTFLLAPVTYNNIGMLPGQNIGVRDYFSTLNRFNAGQVGIETSTQQGRWSFSMSGKGAFGVITQRTQIEGETINSVGANSFVGGVYANTSNIGTYTSNKFAIGVDANATIGYMFTPRFMGTVGYNYFFLNNVVRAGNSLSQTVDPSTAPGYGGAALVPAIGSGAPNVMNDTFWMHGVNFGFSLTF